MRKFYISDIEWDTDGEKIETLPIELLKQPLKQKTKIKL